MEELGDDDFSELYADVEMQASSAISAMHLSTETRRGGKISSNAAGGEKEVKDGINRAEIAAENHQICENDGGGGGGSTNLPMENGDIRRSKSQSEDDLDSGGDDRYIRKFDNNYDYGKYDNRVNIVEFGVTNASKREGKLEIEEDEYDGNYNSQRKGSKYNSSNTKKRRVDEMACKVHNSCKNRDADVGDGELCFRGDIEYDKTNLGRKYGGPNNASERSLDLYKCGSVQISDSVEDNHSEVSESDSDGMTEETEASDDTNRRRTSRTSIKVSSAVEAESSESDWSQLRRGPSRTPNPRAALSDKYIGKRHTYSRHPSTTLARESKDAINREYHPSNDSKSRCVARGTRDGRYCERQKGNARKHSNQPKKYNDMSYLKTCWNSKDVSYAINVKRQYNTHARHGKQRALVGFGSNRNDMLHCSQSERFLTDSGGFPAYCLGPAYLKNQYWDTHPSSRYKQGWPDGQNLLEKSSKKDRGALGDDWYHNQTRHPMQRNMEGLRNLTPKQSSSAINRRGTKCVDEGDNLHFKRRTREDHLSPLHEPHKRSIEARYRRICSSSGRNRDNLDYCCHRNIARDRREMESYGRGKRRQDSPLNRSESLWYTETEVNDRRNTKHQPFTFNSTEESCGPGRGQCQAASKPKPGVPERSMRCSWEDMNLENGRYGTNTATSDTIERLRFHHSENYPVRRHYQQPSKTYIMNEIFKKDRDEDHFGRRRYHRHSELLDSRREVYKSRQQDDTIFHSDEPSYHFRRISRNNSDDERHAFGCVAELVDKREANRHKSEMMREEDDSNQFDGCHKSAQPNSYTQIHPRYQDSVDQFVDVGRKCTMHSSRRTLEAEEDKYYDRQDLMGRYDNQKSKRLEDSDDFNPQKAVLTNEGKIDASLSDKNRPRKFSVNQQDEFLDIEEGQIITEKLLGLVKCAHQSEDLSQIKDKGYSETASNGNEIVQGLDDQKIWEIMVKMERRRERFKEPITASRDPVKTSNPLPDLDVESADAVLERPARKRRWSGT